MGEATDVIRHDIDRTQRELAATAGEIQRRLTPRYIAGKARESLRRTSVTTTHTFIDRIKENPVPATMVGVGLWLLLRNHGGGDGHDVELEEAESPLRARLDDVKERVHGMTERTQSRAHAAGANAQSFLHDNPLIAGLAIAALGAIAGSIVPESRMEDQLMGRKRDELLDRGKELAREGLGRARHVASTVVDTAKGTAREEARALAQKARTDTPGGGNIVTAAEE